jgi:hypothetical protein
MEAVKPKKHTIEYYDWSEVRSYIEKKFNCSLDWMLDAYDIRNGAIFRMYVDEDMADRRPEWVNTILGYLRAEFGDMIVVRIVW